MSTIEEARILAAKIKNGGVDAGAGVDRLLEIIENTIQAQSSLQGKFKTADDAKALMSKQNKKLEDKNGKLCKKIKELEEKNKELEEKNKDLSARCKFVEDVIRDNLATFYKYYSDDNGAIETIAKTSVEVQFKNFVAYAVKLSKHDSNVSRMLFGEYYAKLQKIAAAKGDEQQDADKAGQSGEDDAGIDQASDAQEPQQTNPQENTGTQEPNLNNAQKNNSQEQDKLSQNPHSQRLKQYQEVANTTRELFDTDESDEKQAAAQKFVKAIDAAQKSTDRLLQALKTSANETKPKPAKPKKPNKGKAARKPNKISVSKGAKLAAKAGRLLCPVCGGLTSDAMSEVSKLTNKLQSVIALSKASECKTVETGIKCKNCGLILIDPQENPPIFPGRLINCEDFAYMVALHTAGVTIRGGAEFLFPNIKIGNSTLDKNIADGVQVLYRALLDYIRERIINTACVHADETPVRIFDQEEQRARNMYLLQASTPSYAEEAAIIIEGPTDRKKDTLLAFLQQFHPKALCTDCYKPYQSVTLYDDDDNDVAAVSRRQSCLAHLMTKCTQVFDQFGKVFYAHFDECCGEKSKLMLKGEIHADDTVMALICIARILSKISAVFAFERQALEAAKEESAQKSGKKFESSLFKLRKQVRSKVARELMDDTDVIMEFLGEHFAQKKGSGYIAKKEVEANIADCVVYYLNNRRDFRAFLDNPMLDVDNSVCEINHIMVAKYRDTVRLVRDLNNKDVSMMLSIMLTLCANNITDAAGYLSDAAAWYSNNGRLRVDIEARRKWWHSEGLCGVPMKRTNYTDYKELYRIKLPQWLHFDVWPTLSLKQRMRLRCDVSDTLEPYNTVKHTQDEIRQTIDGWVHDFKQREATQGQAQAES